MHPLVPKDAARRYPILKYLPDGWVERLLSTRKPTIVSKVTGVRSITGVETEGWFIGCPLTPHMMVSSLPLDLVYERIVQCTELAAREGAGIIGLGAFTSVVGDGGITVAKRSPIAVTTGNSYTVATAIEGALRACDELEIVRSEAILAVVGATGSIGRTCAQILAPEFSKCVVIGRDRERTEALLPHIVRSEASTDIERLKEADVIVTVTSSETDVILPDHLKPGSIVCDVARPRDVSVRVSKERPDVLVIEGGVVAVPGDVDFGMSFGFPPKTAYACMSETMMLALEGRLENFTLGKDVSVHQVRESQAMAAKHGFKLAGFRSFEREVSAERIEQVRNSRKKLAAAAR